MTEQHKASPEQWAQIESYAATDLNDDYAACLLDIRARVEALEDAENDRRFEQAKALIDQPTAPAPTSSLVERVAGAISTGRHSDARAAIRAVAAWLRERSSRVHASVQIAGDLEQEANRG